MASMTPGAIMCLRLPSGLSQPMRQQNSRDSAAQLAGARRRTQQYHFPDGEVPAVITTLDLAGHPAAVQPCLFSSLIDYGSQGDRSSGGLPPLFAQASSHAWSQRRMSMPFEASVPMTEYITAVSRSPEHPFGEVIPDHGLFRSRNGACWFTHH